MPTRCSGASSIRTRTRRRCPRRPTSGLAFYPDALYVLVSLSEDEADPATGTPSVRAWRIVDGVGPRGGPRRHRGMTPPSRPRRRRRDRDRRSGCSRSSSPRSSAGTPDGSTRSSARRRSCARSWSALAVAVGVMLLIRVGVAHGQASRPSTTSRASSAPSGWRSSPWRRSLRVPAGRWPTRCR